MAEQSISVRIVFDELSRADANKAVQDLRTALLGRLGDDVAASIEKTDPDSQDAGEVLVLLFASSAAMAVAQGVRAYLARWADQRDRITITTADGATIVATGEPARRLDAAMLLRAAKPTIPIAEQRPTAPLPQHQPRERKHVILFLAANPLGTDRLALDREAREIGIELERSGHRDRFDFVTRWAAEPLDLLRELRKLKPTVVHFTGHGSGGTSREPSSGQAPRRDISAGLGHGGVDARHGLYFQDPRGHAQLVSAAALEQTFGAAGASVRLVVLSACYSDVQARALLAHVDCVVGMQGAIDDDAARNFAIGFYGGLGEGESVASAYKQGRAAISLQGLRDSERPQLEVRPGLDASQLVLADSPRT
jgi:hypothetical protein